MELEEPGKTSAKGKVIGGIIFGAIITVLLVMASGFRVETKRYRNILYLLPYHNSSEVLPQTLWSQRESSLITTGD